MTISFRKNYSFGHTEFQRLEIVNEICCGRQGFHGSCMLDPFLMKSVIKQFGDDCYDKLF